MKKVITPSDALAAYERAFRAGSPRKVEELLREMLNVQVAVVKDKDTAEGELRQGKQLKTVSVPYGVFIDKIKGKTVYRLKPSAQRGSGEFLVKVKSIEDIRSNFTYVLLAKEAGYIQEKGLTFEGTGDETDFESQPDAEEREKMTSGLFQSWEEHARGVWERSARITNFYRPFIERWAEKVLELTGENLQSFVDSLIWAMRIAVYFHDVGKLNKQWQEVTWENEQKISRKTRNGYIARTSPLSSPDRRNELNLKDPPFHAPFAYPFLRALLKKILGDYRFLDTIALAAARHHSLEVTGAIERGKFEWDTWNGERADEWLKDKICEVLGLSDHEVQKMEDAMSEAAKQITEASKADEPPGPTDDFYFLYCIVNRLVKVCDWEDAGDANIELR